MKPRDVRLAAVLLPTSSLRRAVRTGLQALASSHIQCIAEPERTKVGDSLDLDHAARSESPESNRWDYIISVPAAQRLVGIEPHSAKDSEITVVKKKRDWAVRHLRAHLPPHQRVMEWLWVASGSVGFANTERAMRRINQAGVRFVGRVVRSFE